MVMVVIFPSIDIVIVLTLASENLRNLAYNDGDQGPRDERHLVTDISDSSPP